MTTMSGNPSEQVAIQYATSDNLNARIALHRKYTPAGQDMLDMIWQHYEFKPGQSVLDIGCGTGAFWSFPAGDSRPPLELALFDQSAGMIATAREQHLEGAQFGQATADQLPFANQSFDIVLAHFMLYHVERKQRALEEFRRVARDWVGIVLVNADSTQSIYDALLETDATLTLPPSDAQQFCGDEATALIQLVFPEAHVYHYEYTMQVTEAEDIIAYARSSEWTHDLDSQFWTSLRDRIQQKIDENGFFAVSKGCTLYRCGI